MELCLRCGWLACVVACGAVMVCCEQHFANAALEATETTGSGLEHSTGYCPNGTPHVRYWVSASSRNNCVNVKRKQAWVLNIDHFPENAAAYVDDPYSYWVLYRDSSSSHMFFAYDPLGALADYDMMVSADVEATLPVGGLDHDIDSRLAFSEKAVQQACYAAYLAASPLARQRCQLGTHVLSQQCSGTLPIAGEKIVGYTFSTRLVCLAEDYDLGLCLFNNGKDTAFVHSYR